MDYHHIPHPPPPHHPAMYKYHHPDMYYQHHMAMRSNHTYNNPHGMYLAQHVYDKEGSMRGEKWKADMNKGNIRMKEKERDQVSNREEKPPSQSPPKGKATPLLRSPPPKKRKFVTSWDDTERDEYAFAASPGIFGSPSPVAMKNKDFGGFVSESTY
jgi:hypothetical protein